MGRGTLRYGRSRCRPVFLLSNAPRGERTARASRTPRNTEEKQDNSNARAGAGGAPILVIVCGERFARLRGGGVF